MRPPFFDRLQTVFLVCLLVLLLVGVLLTDVLAEAERERETAARRLGHLPSDGFSYMIKSEVKQPRFLIFATHGYGLNYFFVTQSEQMGVPSSEK